MSRPLASLLLLLAAACAGPQREALTEPPAALPLVQAPPTADALLEALEAFSAHAQEVRQAAARGAPMPPAQARAWREVTAQVWAWLGTSPQDAATVAHAWQQLQATLAADARAYGDVPPGLAEDAMGTLRALAARLPPPPPAPRSLRASVDGPPPSLSWPLEGLAVTSDFGPRRHPIFHQVRMHAGVDLAARPQQSVLAAAPGRVVRVGWNGAHGLQVELQHAGGLRTRYSHLSHAVVAEGDALRRGDVLGLAGRTGRTTGVHLHFEVWLDGQPVDPLELLDVDTPPAEALTVSGRWAD